MDYDKIVESVKNMPTTWYPAILATVVRESIKKSTFKQGQVHIFVRKTEEQYDAVLRNGGKLQDLRDILISYSDKYEGLKDIPPIEDLVFRQFFTFLSGVNENWDDMTSGEIIGMYRAYMQARKDGEGE